MGNQLYQPTTDAARAIGRHLQAGRRRRFPKDTQGAFARRLGVSRATYQKMEAGDLGVAWGSVLRAAQLLGLLDQIVAAFEPRKRSLWEDRSNG